MVAGDASTIENMKNSELSALRSIWLSVYFEINADFPPYFLKGAVTTVQMLATCRTVALPGVPEDNLNRYLLYSYTHKITQNAAADGFVRLFCYWPLLGGERKGLPSGLPRRLEASNMFDIDLRSWRL